MIVDLWLTAGVEGWLYLGSGLLGLAQSGWVLRRHRQEQEQLEVARQELTRYLSVGGGVPDLTRLRPKTQVELLLLLSASLQGESSLKIHELARRSGLCQKAQRQLRSPFWWVRLGGLRFFTNLGMVPEDLEHCLSDAHPLVRAEAIYLVPQQPTGPRVEKVVRELFAPASPARFASHSVLLELGSLASELLARELAAASPADTSSLEVAMRAAGSLASPAMLPVALQHSHSLSTRVQQAAAQLLGAIGGQASVDRLLEMLQEPARAAAAEALGHLVYWQAAPRLAAMLDDSEYEAAYQAALALRRLGPPGLLFLRQASQREQRGARLARLVLSQC